MKPRNKESRNGKNLEQEEAEKTETANHRDTKAQSQVELGTSIGRLPGSGRGAPTLS